MKRPIFYTLAGLVTAAGLVVVPLAAQAGALNVYQGTQSNCGGGGGAQTALCGATQSDDFPTIVKNVINLLLLVIGMIAVIMIIIGGIRYVTSNGDQNQITGAKNTILYAVIGLVVAIMAFAIVNFVITAFTGGGAGGNGSPTIPATQNPGSGTITNPPAGG